jgi:RNA polymerase sigma factor (TIGR02999 family)
MQAYIDEKSTDITQLLKKWGKGNHEAGNELFALVVPNLRRIAQYLLKGERRGGYPEAMELVNQTYLRLHRYRGWRDRQHFFAFAARAMRQYLIDCWRARRHWELVSLEEAGELASRDCFELQLLISVSCLLDQLAEKNPEWCLLVQLKCLFGLTDTEVAERMCIKLRTMQRMWVGARHWLCERAGPDEPRLGRRKSTNAGAFDSRGSKRIRFHGRPPRLKSIREPSCLEDGAVADLNVPKANGGPLMTTAVVIA